MVSKTTDEILLKNMKFVIPNNKPKVICIIPIVTLNFILKLLKNVNSEVV